jgi:membrane-associated phospholipid phosphatase
MFRLGYRGRVTRARARLPLVPLLVAIGCALAMAVVALLALDSPGAHERDAAMLHGFVALDRPRVHGSVVVLAHLADPVPYLLVGLALVVVAVARGMVWRAGAVAALLVVTGASTQAVKHLLAQQRFETWLGIHQVGAAAWPSGHSTAAMTLALCAVLVAPAALRPLVAVLGGAFAAGVGYAVLVLAWHFPSDVLGGFLMAGTWTALAVAALRVVERRAEVESPARRGLDPGLGLGVAAAAGLAAALFAVQPRDAVALYASERPTLVVGALVLAAVAGALAAGLARAA